MAGCPDATRADVGIVPAAGDSIGVMNTTAAEIPELAVVRLRHAHAGHERGAVGVVVSADSVSDSYVVELVVAADATTEVIAAASADLRVIHVV
jgi:hypothetical protein